MKYLYLNIETAKLAVRDKHNLESLAFSVLIKHKYRSSSVNNATYRELKETFKIGNTRLQRIIKNGTMHGFLRREGRMLIAERIKSVSVKAEKYYNVRLDLIKDKTYSLSEIMSMIEAMVIANAIKIKTELLDSHAKARVRSKKRSMAGNTKQDIDRIEGFSYEAIMKTANVKKYKVPMLMKFLSLNGLIKKQIRYVDTGIDMNDFEASFAAWQKYSPVRGHLRRLNGRVVCQTSNTYKYTGYDLSKITLI